VFSSVLQQPNNYTTNYNLSYTKSHHDSPTDAPSLQRRRRNYIEYINAISFYLTKKNSLLSYLYLSNTTHTRNTRCCIIEIETKTDSFTTKIKRQCFEYMYNERVEHVMRVYHVSVNNCSFLRYGSRDKKLLHYHKKHVLIIYYYVRENLLIV
jgi:hypothetical protein